MAAEPGSDLGPLSRVQGLLAVVGEVEGLRAIDIGCGEGEMARALAEQGAIVAGYDPFLGHPDTGWIEHGRGRYRLTAAAADAIPEPSGEADVVLFVFSLHHVPAAKLAAALTEARRLLKPGGRLCVAEPVAEGPNQYVMELYHDETAVRRGAAAALSEVAAPLFGSEQVVRFSERRVAESWESFAEIALKGMRFNGYTEADVLNPEVERRFIEMAELHRGRFDQPVRVNLFA